MESTTPTGKAGSRQGREQGAVYLALVVMLGAFSVALLAAAPLWSSLIQRDKEAELIFRGEQYMRAIHAYQEEHGGAFPTDLKQLLELGPKQRRYIRRLFAEPMNPSGEWALLTQAMAQQTQVPGAEGQQGQNGQNTDTGAEDDGDEDDDDLFSDFGEPEEPPDLMSSIFEEGGFDGPITGQQGGPIVGVYCSVDKRGFRNYKGKENYREWKFNALDLQQQANQQQNQGQGQTGDGGQAGQETRN